MAAPITAWLSLESCAVTAFDTRHLLPRPSLGSRSPQNAVLVDTAADAYDTFNTNKLKSSTLVKMEESKTKRNWWDYESTSMESAEIEQSSGQMGGFLTILKGLQAPGIESDTESASASTPPRRQLIVYSPPAFPVFDANKFSPLDLALLNRAYYPAATGSPTHGLKAVNTWASLGSPSLLEVELERMEQARQRLDDSEEFMPAVQAMLLPDFKYALPPSTRTSGKEKDDENAEAGPSDPSQASTGTKLVERWNPISRILMRGGKAVYLYGSDWFNVWKGRLRTKICAQKPPHSGLASNITVITHRRIRDDTS
ncbi:hypothetical protein B0H14DRAFT_3156627 [Mycena olivaceomarginata]|nr:hypothetical protein B0H14DRAFT_3156627 [Mycena olivaceomarginata]